MGTIGEIGLLAGMSVAPAIATVYVGREIKGAWGYVAAVAAGIIVELAVCALVLEVWPNAGRS